MKIMSPRVHGYLDLVVIAAFALAPTLLGFGSRAASLCYVLAGLHATLTVLTAFPMGLLKMIPFPVHGALEAVMAPLLVASFAANFNNLTLIALLTEGAPDYLDTEVPVGATDLLASYTYRIAFNDGGQNYALACAISSIVFLIVALLAYVNLRFFGGAKAARH